MLAIHTRARFVGWFGRAAMAAAWATCAVCALCAGGCTTAAVVSAGTMVGIAASAVSTGADVYRLGKLDSADHVRFDERIAAVRASADELGLKTVKESDS